MDMSDAPMCYGPPDCEGYRDRGAKKCGTMSETPRTDRLATNYSVAYISMRAQDVVLADFARQLERELNALKDERPSHMSDSEVRALREELLALAQANERLQLELAEARAKIDAYVSSDRQREHENATRKVMEKFPPTKRVWASDVKEYGSYGPVTYIPENNERREYRARLDKMLNAIIASQLDETWQEMVRRAQQGLAAIDAAVDAKFGEEER